MSIQDNGYEDGEIIDVIEEEDLPKVKNKVSKETIRTWIKHDPLFEHIQGTSREDELFGPELFDEEGNCILEEKRLYPTSQVTRLFSEVNKDSTLRYYVKPMIDYVFKDIPSANGNTYRFDILAIVRVKMILLLKDDFQVPGLQKLVGITGDIVREERRPPQGELMDERMRRLFELLGAIDQSESLSLDMDEDGKVTLEIDPEKFAERFGELLEKERDVLKQQLLEEIEGVKQLLPGTPDPEEEQEKLKLEAQERELERKSIAQDSEKAAFQRLVKIEIDALEAWKALPDAERMYKSGWWSRPKEDVEKRMDFILEYKKRHGGHS